MRLFLAVWPAAPVVDALRAVIDRDAADGVRWTTPEQWHVTLRFLGHVADDDVDAVAAAMRGSVEGLAPRTAVAGPRTATFGRSVLVVPVSGLDDIAAATVRATSSFGEPPDDRPFAGHVTLARSGGRRGARGPDLRRFGGRPVTGQWVVDEVTLVRSTTTREGAHYEVLARAGLG